MKNKKQKRRCAFLLFLFSVLFHEHFFERKHFFKCQILAISISLTELCIASNCNIPYINLQHFPKMSSKKKVEEKVVEEVEEDEDEDDEEAPATMADLMAGKYGAEGGQLHILLY